MELIYDCSGDNLVVTELLLNGVFNEMTAAECCSLLSCFVFQEKAQEMPKLTEKLSNALSQLKVCCLKSREACKFSTNALFLLSRKLRDRWQQ